MVPSDFKNSVLDQMPSCLERMRVLGSTYCMWEARVRICFWLVVEHQGTHATAHQLGLCGLLGMLLDGELLFYVIWSRDRNVTLPDVVLSS